MGLRSLAVSCVWLQALAVLTSQLSGASGLASLPAASALGDAAYQSFRSLHPHHLPSDLHDLAAAASASRKGARNASVVPKVDGNVTTEYEPVKCTDYLYRHPNTIECPAGCPFLRMEPDGVCKFTCVRADQCGADDPLKSFPDRDAMQCGPCTVSACQACGTSSNSCGVCQEGFILDGGECHDKSRWFWRSFYFVCFCGVVYGMMYVVLVFLRPITNKEVCHQALSFRIASRMHNPATGEEYPLIGTDVCNSYVAGVGVMLHFSWQWWMMIFSLAVAVSLLAMGTVFGKRVALLKNTMEKNHFDSCNLKVRDQKEQVAKMEFFYFVLVLVIYITTTAFAFWFAVRQRRLGAKVAAETTTMQDYVLLASGLPKMSGTMKVEELLTEAFEKALEGVDAEVVGISPCWDFRIFKGSVEEQVCFEMELLETETEARMIEAGKEDITPLRSAKTSARGSARDSSRRRMLDSDGPISKEFRRLDQYLGIRFDVDEDNDDIKPEDRKPRALKAMVEALYTTGQAYVVLRTEAQRNRALTHLQENPPKVFDKEITVVAEDSEPETILWSNLGTKPGEIVSNIIIGCVVLVIAVFLLDIIFYFPSVAYLISVSSVVGHSDGGLQGTILGLLVCACNQIVYFLIGLIADRCGFRSIDDHQRFYVVGYTASVFINTLIDLCVVMLAQGYTMEQAITSQISSDSSMSVKSIAENPAVQMTVYLKFSEYIFPSCLLIPFLAEPLVCHFVFQVKKWIVRSRPDVSVQQAEIQLACPPFDLARYGDILINVMLCCGTLAFTYRDLYILWICLFVSLVMIYCWDKYRFLRVSSRSVFVSQALDITAQHLSSVPCAICAACLVFRLYGMKDVEGNQFLAKWFHVKDWVDSEAAKVGRLVNRDTIMLVISVVIVLHIYVHTWALKNLVPRWADVVEKHDEEVDYQTTSEHIPCNWFNGNPIHVLRSKYLFEHKSPVVAYVVGREYLLQPVPELGCYYDMADTLLARKHGHHQKVHQTWSGQLGEVKDSFHELKTDVLEKIGRPRSISGNSPDSPKSVDPAAKV